MPTGIYKRTKEQYRKIGLANSISNKEHIPWMKGKHHSEKTKKKLSWLYKGKLKIKINRYILYDLYINKKRTCKECSKYFKCSESCIVDRLKIYKIKQRSKSECKLGRLNPMHGKVNRLAVIKSHTEESIEKRRRTVRMKFKNGEIKHPLKGKTYEQRYGLRAKEIKKKLVKSHKEYIKKNPQERKRLKKLRDKIVLPLKDTSIEIKIQNFLKKLGISFFTHQYIKEIKHGYQCDILIPSMNLVIECDGDYWHKYPIGNEIDYTRTKELIDNGFKVLRLWEREIKVMSINDFEKRLEKY